MAVPKQKKSKSKNKNKKILKFKHFQFKSMNYLTYKKYFYNFKLNNFIL